MKKTFTSIPHGYTRVTDVLNPYSDLCAIDPDVVAKAAERGTRVHKFCEMYALGLFLTDIDEDCNNYFQAFKNWFDGCVEHVIHCETRCNSAQYKLSGAFDLIVVLRGDTRATLIDIKTPDVAKKSWQLQTAAYQMLALECLQLDVDRRMCLMLPKNVGTSKIIEYTDHARDQELYLQALQLFRFFNS